MTVSEARPRRSRYFAVLLRLRWLVVGVAVLLAILGGLRTARTYANLRSDLAELLPENAPSVQALAELRDRLPGIRHLGVVVQVPQPDALPAAYRLVDALAERVRRYPAEMVAAVRVDSRLEREFAERYALQLMDPADVRALREAVERRRDWDVTRQMGLDLADDEEDPRPSIPFAELRRKYEARFGKPQLRESDRFVSPDGKSVVLLIQAAAQGTGHAADAALLERVQADVEALGFPRAFDARLEVGYGGDVATRVEEAEGLQSDLTLSGVIVIVLVLGVLYWFFGSLTALPLLGVPLFVGTVAAFGLVALPPFSIRSLNSNTAFLGSIVLGNGINAGIILLARYMEERRAGAFRDLAIDRAVHGTYSATAAAALAAAASYASLVFTDFRGFNQFGWIGALGLILCWVAMYTLLPLLLHWFGEGIGRKPVRRLPRVRSIGGFSLMSTLRAWPRAVLVGAALVSSLAVAGLVRRAGDWIEYDLSKLRRADSWQGGERFWGPR
ncbi:MAG TPA: MMPL family transporter, partial [Polyangiaceae bacterium]